MKHILILFVIILSLTGCESKSGRLPVQTSVTKPVKAVVVCEQYDSSLSRLYKIKLIEEGVVAYCRSEYEYAEGDTIMVKPLEVKY